MLVAVMLLATLLDVAVLGLGVAGGAWELAANRYVAHVATLSAAALALLRGLDTARPGPRAPWIALGVGIVIWTAGDFYWSFALIGNDDAPYPSWADAGWLAFYPCAYLCLVALVRGSNRGFGRSIWLDGFVAALAVGAFFVAFLAGPVLDAAEGSTTAVTTNMGNLIADIVLLALLVGVFAAHGWRPGRAWWLLGAGFAVFAGADAYFLSRLAADTYVAGSVLDTTWVDGIALMGLAAWTSGRPREVVDPTGWRSHITFFGSGMAAVGLLVAGGLIHIPASAVVLAAAALSIALARTLLTMRELRQLAETRRLAATDDLTDLPNRRELARRAAAAIDSAAASGTRLALLVLDLDHFKELNDTLGHHAGDLVLAQIGPRMAAALPPGATLGRLGGDEFAVLLPDPDDAEATARELIASLDRRLLVADVEVLVTASIGIARFPDDGEDADALLQRADVAMYEAKRTHAGVATYAPERDRHTPERLAMITELRDAIDEGQLFLEFQPKIDLATGRAGSVEALVRWRHPIRGIIPPTDFIPIAEQTGVIRRLTRWVLGEAIAQAAAWERAGWQLEIAVNVPAMSVLEDDWCDELLARLRAAGVPPQRLRIEITENQLMTDPARCRAALTAISGHGIRVSLDDFGTGYSSLAYLSELPVDELKIDRRFVSGMLDRPTDAAIVQATVDMAARLSLDVVAEGVEDEDTLAALRRFGATGAQGYLFSRPLAAPALAAWLAARERSLDWYAPVAGARTCR